MAVGCWSWLEFQGSLDNCIGGRGGVSQISFKYVIFIFEKCPTIILFTKYCNRCEISLEFSDTTNNIYYSILCIKHRDSKKNNQSTTLKQSTLHS